LSVDFNQTVQMMLLCSLIFPVVAYAVQLGSAQDSNNPDETRYSVCNPNAGSVHQFSVDALDGKNVSMDRYAGKVLMIVNVATFCAYTEQYLDFNPLANKYNNQGLQIAGFPCNQFAMQEPARNDEILNGIKYVRPGNGFEPAANFHIYGKLNVNGKTGHPMYEFLKKSCPPHGDSIGPVKSLFWDEVRVSDVVWNFEKFIVDRQGRPRYRFHPDAWSNGKFVEQFLQQVLYETNNNSSAGIAIDQSFVNSNITNKLR